MRHYNQLFLVFCLVITVGLLQFWHEANEYFSPAKELGQQLTKVKTDLQREKLRSSMASAQLRDFQESVAAVLPTEQQERLSQMSEFQMAQLASVVRVPASESIDMSSTYMAQATESFRQRKYTTAAQEFQQVISRFPASASTPVAHFMLAESYYLAAQPSESLDVIEKMMNLFPENDMTGFIMLRMGQIFQDRKQPEKAAEVYRTVIDQFGKNIDLKKQAEKLLKTTEA